MVTTENQNSYDEVPYPDLCYVQTHPALLGMLGQLLGMSPAPAENCRVLEIGTAAGGNLLPMAAVLPNSTFIGMDYSIVQIERAQLLVRESGLTNITFKHMDIMDITPEFGQFDYIIVHGIFSWVPPAVQEKLLTICKENLAPQGIAYVSYNTYPGWHMLDIIRNQMLYRTRNMSISERFEPAREWVSFMAHALSNQSSSAYASVFESYLAFRTNQSLELDHAAQLHDELEDINMPLYFHQFMERAEQHQLQFLAETEFQMSMTTSVSQEVMDHLKTIAHNIIETEQYFDFVHDRTFRRTLLCHEDIAVNRRLSTQHVQNFYISSPATMADAEPEHTARGIQTFVGSDGSKFASDHPLTKAAFHYLIETSPLRISFRDLIQRTRTHLTGVKLTDEDASLLAGNLLKAFTYSDKLIEFHSFAPQMTTTVSQYPLATGLARYQAGEGPEVANLLHRRGELDSLSRLVLANLDGESDRTTLLNFLMQWVDEGKISLSQTGEAPKTPDEIRTMMANNLDATLQKLASLGFVVS